MRGTKNWAGNIKCKYSSQYNQYYYVIDGFSNGTLLFVQYLYKKFDIYDDNYDNKCGKKAQIMAADALTIYLFSIHIIFVRLFLHIHMQICYMQLLCSIS